MDTLPLACSHGTRAGQVIGGLYGGQAGEGFLEEYADVIRLT
jgi:hypothetical protein